MEEQNNLLHDFSEATFEYATAGQRFLNWIIDLVAIYILVILSGFIFGLVIAMSDNIEILRNQGYMQIISLLLYFAIMFLYYTLMEGTKGKTLGKLLTKTRVLSIEGERISYGKAFVRTLIRFVPFEFASGFSGTTMWHDQWTYTMLIKDK